MEDFTALKLLSNIEKILNIHRDFWYLPKRKRNFILLAIILELVITIPFLIDNLRMFEIARSEPVVYYSNVIFHTVFIVHSITIILYFGPRFGGEFQKLLSSVSSSHEIVKCYEPYRKSIYGLKFKCLYALFSFVVVRVIACVRQTILFTGSDNSYERVSLFSFSMYMFLKVMYECRCVVVLSTYYCLLATVKSMLLAVTALVEKADQNSLTENMDILATVYRQLLETCRLINNSFSQNVSTVSSSLS